MLTFGSLFAGIGGIDLGLEQAGMKCVWQVEIDDYCNKVLKKHWPKVPRYKDIRTLKGMADSNSRLRGRGRTVKSSGEDQVGRIHSTEEEQTGNDLRGKTLGCSSLRNQTLPYVDLICGGFPCQDISYAGKGEGIKGKRSGLWNEMARLVGEIRPRYVLVENVPALLNRGIHKVLGDLAEIGYDAEWDCISARSVGAPHLRRRVFILAYSRNPAGREQVRGKPQEKGIPSSKDWKDNGRSGKPERAGGLVGEGRETGQDNTDKFPHSDSSGHMGYPAGEKEKPKRGTETAVMPSSQDVSDTHTKRIQRREKAGIFGGSRKGRTELIKRYGNWVRDPAEETPAAQSFVGRVAYGVPARVDRLKCLGNAVVPQVAEFIGRRIIEFDKEKI